jgi:uncharacterized iron-regulated membrane protein
MSQYSKAAKNTRSLRKFHKWVSLPFVAFLLVIGVTAILLAWKKQIGLIPKTQKSQVEQPGEWIAVEKIMATGQALVRDSLQKSDVIERVDIRPDKGIAKVVFKNHFTEVQVDGYSGKVLSVAQRNSDLVEKIHDGSILDFLFAPDGEISKIIYTTMTSLVLIFLGITGFFLWYYPHWIKKSKKAA